MQNQDNIDFLRISAAIEYINSNYKLQPGLLDVAEKIHVSPFHFQKLFTEWAGTSPKKFLQYISIEHAKKMLRQNNLSLSDAAMETGLSGPGRLHDLFMKIEGMTPGEYKNGGINLSINYSFAESPFGKILIASTSKGICYAAFAEDDVKAFQQLKLIFPNALFKHLQDNVQQSALRFFSCETTTHRKVKLHLKGTLFQLKVWEALLKIPMGQLSTYGNVAKAVDHPKASRAVGTAIGDNPVAFLIPCHRVIQSTGIVGGYHWGSTRKAAMIGWEAARSEVHN